MVLNKSKSLTQLNYSLYNMRKEKEGIIVANILWGIIVVLVVFWLIGFALQIGGGLIHFLLIIAGIIFIYQLITGKRKL